jgi:hypothetical protein
VFATFSDVDVRLGLTRRRRTPFRPPPTGSRILHAHIQMFLTLGARLWLIAATVGEEEMGEAYRARDTRLDRDAAFEILPEADPNPCR